MYAHDHLNQDNLQRDIFLADKKEKSALAALIDQTLLRPDASQDEYTALVEQAAAHGFRAVCLPSSKVKAAQELLNRICSANKRPLICTVIGFPHGHACTDAKVSEVKCSRTQGAMEFDYVQNLGWVRDKMWKALSEEAESLVAAAQGGLVKVILETSCLSPEEIYESALAAARGGVHVLKTSTGYGTRGAVAEDLTVLSRVAELIEIERGFKIGIKASGGIKTFEDALRMIRAGATRLGTSGGIALINGQTADPNSY